MRYVLAIDQGTTSSRAILFDVSGAAVAMDQLEITQHFPKAGWVEHDAEEIWESVARVTRGVLAKAGVEARDVAALGITNQRETSVIWDRATGKALRAIVWQDRRTAGICARLREQGVEQTVRRKTGLILDPYFSATKIAWMLSAVGTMRDRANRGELAFGTIDSWLLWKLTAGDIHATDHTNASRTLLFNLETLDWDDELLAIFDVPRTLLPEIRPSISSFGTTSPLLFGAPIPIAAVAGDQQAALFGQAGFRKGRAKTTYGTGSFVMLNTANDIVRSEQLLSTVAYTSDSGMRAYALEGSIFSTGAAVQWLRDGLCIIKDSDEVETLAASVPDNGGVYFVPGFTGLGAPYWDPYARGTIVGIERGTTRAHVARAALEAIAYRTVDVCEVMERDANLRLDDLRVDGGAARNTLLLQFQADMLDATVVRSAVTETTALGVASMAGLQCGVWRDLDHIEKLWTAERRFTPSMDDEQRMHRRTQWQRAVERSLGWAAP